MSGIPNANCAVTIMNVASVHEAVNAYLKIVAVLLGGFFILTCAQSDSCWLNSYGRGVGKPISTCADGLEQNGLLCYPKCAQGYYGVGPVCWQHCTNGFRDDGAFCYKPQAYGRGAGYVLWEKNKCEKSNPQGCEKNGLLWYPKCKEGFHNVGCCICSPNCPAGQTDIGISCAKGSYGRTAGKPLTCTKDQELSGALCYPPCRSGYHGVGPVCWGVCPPGLTQCGALCLKDQTCIGKLKEIGETVKEGAAAAISKISDGPMAMIKAALPSGLELVEELMLPICS